MGKTARIWLMVLFALIITGIVAYILWPREPVFEGRPLSSWLERGDWVKAREAMDSAGTNAIPVLLHMLRVRDFPFKLKAIAMFQKLPFVHFEYVTASERNERAASAFGMLGASAGYAVPPLVEIYNAGTSTDSVRLTAFALGSIGPTAKAAVPSLLRSLASPTVAIRQSAVRALGQIRSDAESVVPALADIGLKDPAETVRVDAILALESFGVQARSAIPTLTDSLHDTSAAVRSLAAHALGEIGGVLPQSDSETGSKGSTNTLPSAVLDRK